MPFAPRYPHRQELRPERVRPHSRPLTTRQGRLIPCYRGTSLIRNRRPLGPYSRDMPRSLWWSWGGGAVSHERGTCTPVSLATVHAHLVQPVERKVSSGEIIFIELTVSFRHPERARNEETTGPTRLGETRCATYTRPHENALGGWMYIRGSSECIYFVQLISLHPQVPCAPRYPQRWVIVVGRLRSVTSSQFLPLEPFPPEAGPSRTRSSHAQRSSCLPALPEATLTGERIFIELMTSDRKLKASREGSECRNYGTYTT